MDAYEKFFAKREAERELAEKEETEEILIDKIDDKKRTKGTIEKEIKLTENQKDDIKPLEELENEKKQSVNVEPENSSLFKQKVIESVVNNRTSNIKKPKRFNNIYVIGLGILSIIIIVGVVIILSNRTQSVREELKPIDRPSALVYTGSSFPAIQDIFKISRDAFGSEMEFRTHQQDAVNSFNDAVKHHNPDYQVATAILDIEGLDTDSGKLPLSINWKIWTKQLDREGYIIVPGDNVEALLKDGKQRPVYIYLDIVEGTLTISKTFLIGFEKEITVSFWPGGTLKYDPVSGMQFVWIPGRSFIMGSSVTAEGSQGSEKPAHEVFINGFWMGKYEVTQSQSERIMGQNNSGSIRKPSAKETGKYPVMFFNDEFVLRLNKNGNGDIYRLPSEAEWEYAARAGSNEKYCYGDDIIKLEKYAWYRNNSEGTVHPVGELRPNKWGLYDMHGNVPELCEDAWHANYDNAPIDGSVWKGGHETTKVLRGGGIEDPPVFLRSASRGVSNSDSDSDSQFGGFRLVRSGGFLD